MKSFNLFVKTLLKLNIKNQSGMGILQVTVVLAITTLIGANLMMMADANRQALKLKTLKTNMQLLTDSLSDLINDDKAWRSTISDAVNNPSMACILNGTDCSAFKNVYTDFVPRNVNGTFFLGAYNPLANATQGFSPDGVICNTYSTTTPSDLCPFRYTFQWRPACPVAAVPCIKPNISINILANHSTAKMLKINTNVITTLYSPSFIRGIPDLAVAQAICGNLGRVWDAVLYSCVMPVAGSMANIYTTCTSGSYDEFLQPNGLCYCPVRCPIKVGESYTGAISPNVYTITMTCACTTNSIQ